jgi:hypothetical protein
MKLSLFFETINKIDELLAKLINLIREKTQINKVRNPTDVLQQRTLKLGGPLGIF